MTRGKTIQVVVLLLLLAAAGSQADNGERRGAMLRSALLPGLGQIHLGHDTRGAIFIGVEAVTWAGFGLSYLEGVFERDDYTMLALEEAGISMSDRSSQFMDDVSDFGSSAEFNDYIHRLARYYFPDDPDAQREYYETHARYGADGWTWSSEDAMRSFGDHLRDSRQWFRRSLYIAAFALVNRAVSVIDAALLDPAAPGIYTDLSFPETGDFSSVRFALGARF
jgi:hypothetical protein